MSQSDIASGARPRSEPTQPDPFANRLLGALSEASRKRLQARITVHTLERQQYTNLYDAPLYNVDFPIDAVMSVVATLAGGGTCEVAAVGREGFVEIDAALASRIAQRTSFCQIPGSVARIPIDAFEGELEGNPEFRAIVLRAVRARAFMTEQLATCNLKHPIVARFARWLLMTRDRLGDGEFNVTHEMLATMLGARRAGVSQSAATLQAGGCITYRRGIMKIVDGAALAAHACECYVAEREAIDLCFQLEAARPV